MPDCAALHVERRKPGVTLELLYLEYLEQHPDGYRYTQFGELYRRWLHRRRLSMRQVHHAGDKCFVDYAGKKPHLIDAVTGEVTEVELFVAVLGASNYTYAEATRTEQVPDWRASHQRAFQSFGGVTTAVVCDQLKSGVTLWTRRRNLTTLDLAASFGHPANAGRDRMLIAMPRLSRRRNAGDPRRRRKRVAWRKVARQVPVSSSE